MVKHFDHVTIVVRNVEAAKRFFSLLGFEHEQSVVISGKMFSDYMGVAGIEAEHVTLVLAGAVPRMEVQLLGYRQPDPVPDPNISELSKVGFNHICFAVEDLEGELKRLQAAGIKTRNEILDFHGRKLVFLRGPEGITVELSERYDRVNGAPHDAAQLMHAVERPQRSSSLARRQSQTPADAERPAAESSKRGTMAEAHPLLSRLVQNAQHAFRRDRRGCCPGGGPPVTRNARAGGPTDLPVVTSDGDTES